MKERQKTTLNLIKDSEVENWLSLTMRIKSNILIGNPDEGEYIRLQLMDFDFKKATFRVFEKKGDSREYRIGDTAIDENVPMLFEKTKFKMMWKDIFVSYIDKVQVFFSASQNIDVVRPPR